VRDNGIRKIAFLGGEPLLNPDIFSFINECYDKGITSYLYTNGVHIDEDVIAKLLNFKDKLVLVFNFDHPKTYAKHKLNDFYDQVYENIKRCKKKRFKIVLFVALTKLNFPFFEDILLIGKKLGVKVKVERYVPLNDAKVNNGLELSAEEWCFAQETYKKIYPRRYITNLIYKKVMKSNCVCYNEALFVMFNGDVLPCPYTTSDFRIGDVNHSPLKQIIKKYDVLKVEWNKIPKGCKGCEKADYCRGGCKTSRFLDHNSLEKKQDCCCK
jgi:radical SAM protein with 4Fe4S-binding SPASM domain